VVDVLPTTIPPGYWADLFVSIHADGNAAGSASGFRAASPRRDATGRAAEFARLLDRIYGETTGLPYYPTVTRRMRGYYAFNHRRYEHALHPMTIGVILETGFLSSPRDRRVLIGDPSLPASGIARAVMAFLEPVPPGPDPTVTRALTLRSSRKGTPADGDQAR
jgi:N-acetylmuramoyl-L-alanine amidase